MRSSGEGKPLRLLFVQTQAEMAGSQEISRLLGQHLALAAGDGRAPFEVHHLFLYRKTGGCDHFPNVRFAAQQAPKTVGQGLRFAWNTIRIIQEIRPDVLLTFQHYGNIVAAPVGRLLGVPRIIANHVSAPATISPMARRIDKWLGLAGFYDVMTVNSQETLRDYQDYPLRYRKRIVYVPHGFADKTVAVSKPDARNSFGLPGSAKLIGTVARLHPLKRIDLAIDILPGLPDVHMAVAGQGPDEERLQAKVRAMNLGDRVHFVGEIGPADVGRFLACLDVFVFPTAAETFGLAAVEAAQAGIPVVSNGLPVLREVLTADGSDCAVFVDVTDRQAFRAAVDRLLTEPEAHASLSRAARRLSSRYSLQAMVERYRDLILDVPRSTGDAAAQRPASLQGVS